MEWIYLIAHFFGGIFLANSMPHIVMGVTGQKFQTPFASPPGRGLSSSTVNVVWGFFNLAVAYALLCHVGFLNLQSIPDVGATMLGALLISLHAARHFGKFHGGNAGD